MEKPPVGFEAHARTDEDTEAINKLFTPEFRNRLDAIVPFKNLSVDTIGKVVDKFVMQLEAQLEDRGVTITLSDDARKWLGDKGYDRAMGARPLSRVIQEHLKKPLSEELLFGKLKDGGSVRVVLKNDKLSFQYPKAKSTSKKSDNKKSKKETV